MKNIKLYEEFTDKTLDTNNKEYSLYYNGYKDDKNRSKTMMWMTEGSQEDNFKMISKYIKTDDSVLDYGCGLGDLITYLNGNDIIVSDYLGVDINENYITDSIENHAGYNFKHITDVDDIEGNWDVVCASGVFTWYIERDEFIKTINKLYEICNNTLLITCNRGDFEDTDKYWKKEYRFYNEDIFLNLFPDFDISFEYTRYSNLKDNILMLVKINKNNDEDN